MSDSLITLIIGLVVGALFGAWCGYDLAGAREHNRHPCIRFDQGNGSCLERKCEWKP